MRILFLAIFLFIAKINFSQCDTSSKISSKDSSNREFILRIKSNNYKKKSIEKIIAQKELQGYCRKAYIQKIIGVLGGVDFSYNGFVTLRLCISQKDSKKFTGKSDDWDFEKLKKCTVIRIEVVDNIDNISD